MPAPSSSSSPDGRSNFERHHDDRSIQKKASITSAKSRMSSEDDLSRANIDAASLLNPGMASSASRQSQSAVPSPSISILPAEKVFPIQIGSELFRLSGASIASDERQKTEICIRLEDLRRSGISLHPERNSNSQFPGWVYYARPFVEDTAYELVLEIGNESTLLDLSTMRADFHSTTKDRVSKLLQVIATKMNLPTNAPLGLMMITGGPSAHAASPSHTPLSAGEDRVKVLIDYSTDILLDGEPKALEWPLQPEISTSDAAPTSLHSNISSPSAQGTGLSTRKRKRSSAPNEPANEWIIQRGQWRLKVDKNNQGGVEITFVAVKLNALTSERTRNSSRKWLG
ncbi:MAG: hypothetical protein Q9160_002739 [Pyrenula sp. 1 TL-2023]